MPDPGYRDYVIDQAIAAGKFPASRRQHYARMHDADPKQTEALIGQLAAGLPPANASAGADAYPQSWVPELAGRPRAATSQSVPAGSTSRGQGRSAAGEVRGHGPDAPAPAAPADGSYPREWLGQDYEGPQTHGRRVTVSHD